MSCASLDDFALEDREFLPNQFPSFHSFQRISPAELNRASRRRVLIIDTIPRLPEQPPIKSLEEMIATERNVGSFFDRREGEGALDRRVAY